MERRIKDRTILDEFVESFCEVMERHAKYIICSGFVAIAHGRARGTEDVDMIIDHMQKDKFVALHKELVKSGFVCIQSDNPESVYDDYLSKANSVRYVVKSESYAPPEMEVKFAKDELDEEQIKKRTKLPLTGLNVYFSTIESNIAFKEEFLASEKDLEDAKHLRIVYRGSFDEKEVEKIKEQIRRRS